MSLDVHQPSDALPRRMSALAMLRLLVANGWVQGGTAILVFGSLLFWVFRPDENLREMFRTQARAETVQGVVMACWERGPGSGKGETSTVVSGVTYRFRTPDGTERTGRCYVEAHGRPVKEGQAVVVEYLRDNPRDSCIRGMRATVMGNLALFFWLPVVAPAAMILIGLLGGWKSIRLLRRGRLATGVLTEVKRLIFSVRGSSRRGSPSVYKLTFEFKTDDGLTYKTVAKTDRLGGPSLGHEQPILYNPADPTYAGVLYALNGSPSINEEGSVRVPQAWIGLPALIWPLFVLAANFWAFLHAIER